MADEERDDDIQEVISCHGPKHQRCMVLSIYDELDALNVAGQLIMPVQQGGETYLITIINTNDDLRSVWYSPQGHYWLVSSSGNLWSTREFNEGSPTNSCTSWDQSEDGPLWHASAIPLDGQLDTLGMPEQLFGFADDDLHCTATNGVVYHYDGRAWRANRVGFAGDVICIHGLERDDVWCGGYGGGLSHWDGERWQAVKPLPSEESPIMGIRVLDDGALICCDQAGHLYRGRPGEGFEQSPKWPWRLYGLVRRPQDGAILVAAGPAGVAELQGDELVIIKDTFVAIGCDELDGCCVFYDGDQANVGPRIIWHNPDDPRPWTATSL